MGAKSEEPLEGLTALTRSEAVSWVDKQLAIAANAFRSSSAMGENAELEPRLLTLSTVVDQLSTVICRPLINPLSTNVNPVDPRLIVTMRVLIDRCRSLSIVVDLSTCVHVVCARGWLNAHLRSPLPVIVPAYYLCNGAIGIAASENFPHFDDPSQCHDQSAKML